MKNLLVILGLLPIILTAQTIENNTILAGQYHNNEVLLRWIPENYDSWIEGMENGYIVSRYIISDINGEYDLNQHLASKTTIDSNVLPLDSTVWDSNSFQDFDAAEAARQLLYSADFNPSFVPSSFEEIISINNTRENRFTFSAMVADRYFEISEAMALGIKDASVNSDNSYRYTLALSSNPIDILAETIINIPKSDPLEKIEKLDGIGADKVIILEWDLIHAKRFYTSFNIERSLDGVNYALVNDVPYVFGSDSKADANPNKAYYKDSIPQNGIDYHYRVTGLSPFGISGPVSDPVIAQGVPGRMDVVLSVAITKEETSEVQISWGGVSAQQEAGVERFEVHRSDNISEDFGKINVSTLSPTSRSFTDYNPLYAGYYIVVMYDINGHYYKSRPVLAQPSDIAPPPIPTGLIGSADDNGEIKISWQDVIAEDFSGYRVFRSNQRNGNYIDISKSDVNEAQFTDVLPTHMDIDSVFYRVKSTDIRGNHSDFSEVLALSRPNTVPPSRAVLLNLMPTVDGIKVSWELSPSADVQYHTLQRKPKDRFGWDDILQIDKGSSLETQSFGNDLLKYNYIDEEDLDPIVYQYRIIAMDNYENQSVSNALEIIPTINNIHAEILNFSGQHTCGTNNNSELTQQINSLNAAYTSISNNPSNASSILTGLVQQGIITYNQYANFLGPGSNIGQTMTNEINELNTELTMQQCEVILSWEYKPDFNVSSVDLYRQEDGGSMELYKSYRPTDLLLNDNPYMALVDPSVKVNNRYYYKIIVNLDNAMTSPLSNEIEVSVQP
ncbi:MAG: hypothetical protein AAGA77_18665 [Bacteroidota bacterium]